MTNRLWAVTARVLASTPVRAALLRYAKRRPHKHLYDHDGAVYMMRWRVIDEGTRASRWLKRLTGYASVRIHEIRREDHDRALHTHPFEYRTVVLRGGYVEHLTTLKDADGPIAVETRRRGDTEAAPRTRLHRIAEVAPDCTTLFFMADNDDAWYFYEDGLFHHAEEYLHRAGYKLHSDGKSYGAQRNEH